MFEVLIIFRDLSPGPATSKNKWVSAFKSVRGKPENQNQRFRGAANHLTPRHKSLMKTLSSTNLERGRGSGGLDPGLVTRAAMKDSASTSASPDRSTLTVDSQTLASSSGWSLVFCHDTTLY